MVAGEAEQIAIETVQSNPDMSARMAARGYDVARLAAQQATAARSTAIAALDAWMHDFLAIARVALAQSA